MPYVTVQLGQCGNQIGTEFFRTLSEDAFRTRGKSSRSTDEEFQAEVITRYFNEVEYKGGSVRLHPRSVLIDMEPKVIAQSVTSAAQGQRWSYSKNQLFSQKSGSGNNWAHGYCIHGMKCDEPIENIVRCQVEQCDRFDGFLCLMSLAGGTGSGVGTYVTEMLRDLYPKAFIVNEVIAPYQSGEVIVQSYNALLTLAHLYQSSDGLIVIENDNMQQICSRLLGLKNVSFTHINKVVAHKMSHLLAPAIDNLSQSNHLGDYVEQVFPHPSYKFSSLLNLPMMSETSMEYSTFQWDSTIRTLRQMLIAKAHMEEGINWGVKVRPASNFNKSVSNILVLRGKDSMTIQHESLKESAMYPRWLPPDNRLKLYSCNRQFSGYEKSASLLTNSQICVDTIDRLVDKAWSMFTSKAYTHQYSRHGLTEDDFLDCFTVMEKVIHDYKTL